MNTSYPKTAAGFSPKLLKLRNVVRNVRGLGDDAADDVAEMAQSRAQQARKELINMNQELMEQTPEAGLRNIFKRVGHQHELDETRQLLSEVDTFLGAGSAAGKEVAEEVVEGAGETVKRIPKTLLDKAKSKPALAVAGGGGLFGAGYLSGAGSSRQRERYNKYY